MDFKILGSILLIVGTTIGAGMLALPIATAELGFLGSVLQLITCWLIMTIGALLLLEVNLWLPQNSNLISMARATIGVKGQVLAWIVYFLLLYSLLCAYIAGGSDLFHGLLTANHIMAPPWLAAILFVLIFGSIVYLGIRTVDYTNRGLMFVKFAAYFFLVILLAPFVSWENLSEGDFKYFTAASALTVTFTSFGYAPIIPSLRIYFAGDLRKLKIAIFIGSLVPLFCYIAWDAVIMGVVPLKGSSHSLLAIMQAKGQTSELVGTLNAIVAKKTISLLVKLFTSICMLTSFLGVALCLADFLADGLQLEKKGKGNVVIHVATFLPPLLIVLFFPNVFIKALEYAGFYCIILLVLLPAWMVWRGRYHQPMAKHGARVYRVPGGKLLLSSLILFSIVMIVWELMSL